MTIKKLLKQDGTQSYDCYRRKINSKAFAIPILTASAYNIIIDVAVRIGIANVLELTFFYNNHKIEFHLVSIVF